MQTLDYSYQKVIIIRNLCQMSKIELGFFFERDRADMGKQDLKQNNKYHILFKTVTPYIEIMPLTRGSFI